MAELAVTLFDYKNYDVLVGTYPNDLQTQLEVEQVQVRFPNVHKVVCASCANQQGGASEQCAGRDFLVQKARRSEV